MNRIFSIAGIFIFCLQAGLLYSQEVKEKNDMGNLDQGNEYYYIRIFDGLFPIPSKYALIVDSDFKSINSLSFTSPLFLAVNQEVSDSGRILIGGIDDCELCELEELASDEMLTLLNRTIEFGLNVLELEVTVYDEPIYTVIFFDDKNYLSIVDEKKGRWRYMLNLYGESQEKNQ